jgi:hypothetical protein
MMVNLSLNPEGLSKHLCYLDKVRLILAGAYQAAHRRRAHCESEHHDKDPYHNVSDLAPRGTLKQSSEFPRLHCVGGAESDFWKPRIHNTP